MYAGSPGLFQREGGRELTSQNCNSGFLVPPVQRGNKIGGALAKAFLEYAPRLGYRASVFNLVYESESTFTAVSVARELTHLDNHASLKLWDALGFKRVGLIPGAGRLRTKDGKGEEYVDAVVIHKSFV
jgi:L-amino acid N-acyltransferase YncA